MALTQSDLISDVKSRITTALAGAGYSVLQTPPPGVHGVPGELLVQQSPDVPAARVVVSVQGINAQPSPIHPDRGIVPR